MVLLLLVPMARTTAIVVLALGSVFAARHEGEERQLVESLGARNSVLLGARTHRAAGDEVNWLSRSKEISQGSEPTRFTAAIGWERDPSGRSTLDLDLSAVPFSASGQMFQAVSLRHKTGPGLNHSGDRKQGSDDIDDELIQVDLDAVPSDYAHIFFVVNVFSKGKSFKNVRRPHCRMLGGSRQQLMRYELAGSGRTGVIFARLERNRNSWSFEALGTFCTGAFYIECLDEMLDILFSPGPVQLDESLAVARAVSTKEAPPSTAASTEVSTNAPLGAPTEATREAPAEEISAALMKQRLKEAETKTHAEAPKEAPAKAAAHTATVISSIAPTVAPTEALTEASTKSSQASTGKGEKEKDENEEDKETQAAEDDDDSEDKDDDAQEEDRELDLEGNTDERLGAGDDTPVVEAEIATDSALVTSTTEPTKVSLAAGLASGLGGLASVMRDPVSAAAAAAAAVATAAAAGAPHEMSNALRHADASAGDVERQGKVKEDFRKADDLAKGLHAEVDQRKEAVATKVKEGFLKADSLAKDMESNIDRRIMESPTMPNLQRPAAPGEKAVHRMGRLDGHVKAGETVDLVSFSVHDHEVKETNFSLAVGWKTMGANVDVTAVPFTSEGKLLKAINSGRSLGPGLQHEGDHVSDGTEGTEVSEEFFKVDFKELPTECTQILLVMNVFPKGASFKDVTGAQCRVLGSAGQDIIHYDLSNSTDGADMNGHIIARLSRFDGTWSFTALDTYCNGTNYLDCLPEIEVMVR